VEPSGGGLARRSVSVTVCPNGLGHAVRALRVLRVLVDDHGLGGSVSVALTRGQLAALQPASRRWLEVRDVTLHHDVVEPGVGLEGAADGYADGRLTAWVARWEDSLAARADLVLSDNLTGVLAARPDAVLMGSFLWSDVLPAVASGPEVDAFVAQERELLAAHRPPMLATADVVHPGVVARTAVVPLPWFDDRRPDPSPPPTEGAVAGHPAAGHPAVAVLGGMTGAAGVPLATAAAALERAGREVVTDPSALEGPERARIGALVCRPGLGTVTSGVVGSLPMLLVREPGNPELEHTAAALVALGVARTLEDPTDAAEAVRALEADDVRARMLAALRARPTGGHREAARWLAGRIAADGGGR
jgi:hypothetical protein